MLFINMTDLLTNMLMVFISEKMSPFVHMHSIQSGSYEFMGLWIPRKYHISYKIITWTKQLIVGK
jgi:uncharacterized membrane protein